MNNISDAAYDGVLLVRSAYECPNMIYHVRKNDSTYFIAPEVGFDWYITGYCVSHFNLRWGLKIEITSFATKEKIDLLVKGLKSVPIAKGRIHEIIIDYTDISLFQIFHDLKEFCQLQSLKLRHVPCYDEDSLVMFQHLIAPESQLKKLVYQTHRFTCAFISLMLDQSSLEELTIICTTSSKIEHLPCKNTNLKKLTLSAKLIGSLETLLPNITSLTYLKTTTEGVDKLELNILTKTVQSLPRLQVLEIEFANYYCWDGRSHHVPTSLLQLIEAAGNSQLKELTIGPICFYLLPSDCKERYKHLLKCVQYDT